MFHLSSAVSRSHKLEEDDVLKTKFALKDIGYYDEPEYGMTPYSDERMFDSIKKFQKDKGLEVDGIMYPEGETASTIGNMIAEPWRRQGNPQIQPMSLDPNEDPFNPDPCGQKRNDKDAAYRRWERTNSSSDRTEYLRLDMIYAACQLERGARERKKR
jgi:hypothetical protein